VETQITRQAAVGTSVVPSLPLEETAARWDVVVEENIIRVTPGFEADTEKQGSICQWSSATPLDPVDNHSGSEDHSVSSGSVDGSKKEEVANEEESKADATVCPTTPRKRRQDAANEIEGKRRKYGVEFLSSS